jgi:hypothetical protein
MALCYKDRSYCNAGPLCAVVDCERRMTVADAEAARAQSLPICYIDFTTAPCFVPFFGTDISDKPKKRIISKKTYHRARRLDQAKKRSV